MIENLTDDNVGNQSKKRRLSKASKAGLALLLAGGIVAGGGVLASIVEGGTMHGSAMALDPSGELLASTSGMPVAFYAFPDDRVEGDLGRGPQTVSLDTKVQSAKRIVSVALRSATTGGANASCDSELEADADLASDLDLQAGYMVDQTKADGAMKEVGGSYVLDSTSPDVTPTVGTVLDPGKAFYLDPTLRIAGDALDPTDGSLKDCMGASLDLTFQVGLADATTAAS